jgi:hypothetical protein
VVSLAIDFSGCHGPLDLPANFVHLNGVASPSRYAQNLSGYAPREGLPVANFRDIYDTIIDVEPMTGTAFRARDPVLSRNARKRL